MREWQRGRGEGKEEKLALLNCCMYLRVSELIYQLLHKLNARNWKSFRPVIKILKLNASSFPFLTTKRNRSGSRDLGISRKMPHCGTAPHLGPVDQIGKSRKKNLGRVDGVGEGTFQLRVVLLPCACLFVVLRNKMCYLFDCTPNTSFSQASGHPPVIYLFN